MNSNRFPIRARLPGSGYRNATEKALPLARPPAIQRAEDETAAGVTGEPGRNLQGSSAPGEASPRPVTAQQVADAVYRLMMEDLRRERERRAR